MSRRCPVSCPLQCPRGWIYHVIHNLSPFHPFNWILWGVSYADGIMFSLCKYATLLPAVMLLIRIGWKRPYNRMWHFNVIFCWLFMFWYFLPPVLFPHLFPSAFLHFHRIRKLVFRGIFFHNERSFGLEKWKWNGNERETEKWN